MYMDVVVYNSYVSDQIALSGYFIWDYWKWNRLDVKQLNINFWLMQIICTIMGRGNYT